MATPGFANTTHAGALHVQTDPRLTEAVASLLARVEQEYRPAVYACSFSAEDCVLFDLVVRYAPSVEIVTLDTGRLPQETYDVIAAYTERCGKRIHVLFPDPAELAVLTVAQGVNGFYQSIAARKACCMVRKVHPLAKVLSGKRAWITGLRRAQSENRSHVTTTEFDSVYGIPKFNPLAEWSDADVWSYIRDHRLPTHGLYAQGYTSIGCAPCTRAVTPGDKDVRSGRWWWETAETKECGLHAQPDGRLKRRHAEATI